MMDDARRDMAASSERLGMTLTGQLKTAKAKADRQEEEMEAKFSTKKDETAAFSFHD